MYRQAVLIYNPAAGRRRFERERLVARAVEVLRRQAEAVEAIPTGGPGSATEMARQACRSGADLVLACGGDGTINEVVNGLAHSSTALAVLPAGTANVAALEMGIPVDPVKAAEMLPGLEPRRLSLGRVHCLGSSSEPRYFLLLSGTGVDARIVYTLSARLKSSLGIVAYWVAGLGRLGKRLEPFQVEVDQRRFEATFALASKSRMYGGRLRIARRAHLLAGDLEVVLFHSRSSVRYLLYLAAVVSGALDRLPDVTFLRTHRLAMEAAQGSRVDVEVDGEYTGRLPAVVEIVPDALTLLMPAGYIQAHG